MGASSVLGLLFEISADPSGAEAAIAKFNEATGNALADAAGKTKPLDDALLSNRESVRLLSEEVGVHLPRAVSGAIAEMMPGINAIGPALLAAFALKEIPQFIKGIDNASDALGGYISTVKEFEAANVKASNAALIHFKTIAIGEKLIGDTNRALAQLAKEHEGWNEFARVMVEKQTHSWQNLLGPLGTAYSLYKAGSAAIRDQNEARDQEAKLQARLIEQLNQLNTLEAKQHAEQEATWGRWSESLQDHAKTVQKVFDQGMSSIHQNALKVEKDFDAVAASSNRAAKAEIDFALRLEEFGIVEQRQAPQIITSTEQQAEHTKHLSDRRKELIWVTQELHKVEEAFKNALKGDFEALHQAEEWAAGIGERFAGLIAGTKAAAEVRGAFDAAQAIEYWATFIASWGTDTAAGAAAVQYSLAAAEMFKVAGGGGSGAHIGGGGGGGGGGQSSYGRGGAGGGAGGSGQGTLHITYIQNAPMFTPQSAQETIQMLAPVFSSAVKSGQITLTATNAITNGPKQTGH